MARGLSYPSLTKILEALEANKRSCLVAHSPFLQSFDRKIPLLVDHLSFNDHKITVNDVRFHFIEREVLLSRQEVKERKGLTPGDIELNQDYPIVHDKVCYVKFYFKDRQVGERRFPEGLSLDMAMKKSACHFFEKREDIKVRKLRILSKNNVLRLPAGAKFITSEFDTAENDLTVLEPLIHPSSLPLKVLKLGMLRNEYHANTLIGTAETLILEALLIGHPVFPFLLNMRNRSIKAVGANFTKIGLTRIVKNIKENGRELGSTVTVPARTEVMEETMRNLKKDFNGEWVTSQEVEETLPTSDILYISLNETSEILIYGFMEAVQRIRFKIVPIGSSIPIPSIPPISPIPPIPDKKVSKKSKFTLFSCIR